MSESVFSEMGPLLVHGASSSTKSEARLFSSVILAMGRKSPVCTSIDKGWHPRQLASSSMLIIMGWEALEHQVQILAAYRNCAPRKPVVVLGRNNDPHVRTSAFVNGANNFVPPDCTETELLAIMLRLLDLSRPGMQNAPVAVKGLEIWPDQKVVLKDGRRVRLSRRELAMLLYLAKVHPEAVSRQTLEREVFGLRGDPGTNVVAVHVHRLRKKISEDEDLLQTVPGGYQLG